jgi:hypothetical protein
MEPPTRRHPGDLICGQCGEGNDPNRHFCRRCGSSLDEAVVVSTPWYRRIFKRRVYEAGGRKKVRFGLGHAIFNLIRAAILALVVLSILLYALVPGLHSTVNARATQTFNNLRVTLLPRYDPIHPVQVLGSSSVPGHSPTMATDTYKNTYWGVNTTRDRQPTLRVTFDSPYDIGYLIFTDGIKDNFQSGPRPKDVHIVFSDGTFKNLTLADTFDPQKVPVDSPRVTTIEITILDTYASLQGNTMALTEVEFFQRH